jgi:acetyl esterase/lipase
MTEVMMRRFRRHFFRVAALHAAAIFSCQHSSPALAEDGLVVPLYAGVAPGSESWKQQEREIVDAQSNQRMVVNVVRPTLTVVPADPAKANGTGVVICPGGGFIALSVDSEGFHVAKFLAKRGVTCFVLKYRLMESYSDGPLMELLGLMTHDKGKRAFADMFKIATGDGLAAMRHVREHAGEYGVDPERVGILGFSAGGMVATAVAVKSDAAARPACTATIYGAYDLAAEGDRVPDDVAPLFVAVAGDDPLNLAPPCIATYQAWAAAGEPAELHVYMKGGHGFGMNQQGLPIDAWAQRYVEWLGQLGLVDE